MKRLVSPAMIVLATGFVLVAVVPGQAGAAVSHDTSASTRSGTLMCQVITARRAAVARLGVRDSSCASVTSGTSNPALSSVSSASGPSVSVSKSLPPASTGAIGTYRRTSTRGAVAAVVGQCNGSPSDTSLDMTWTYQNGVLTGSTASLFSRVVCTSSPPMAALSDLARLYKDNENIYGGTLGDCTKCLQVLSHGYHACAGYSACGGYFQMIWYYSLQLPTGWTWSTWSSDCSPLSRGAHFNTLACDGYTGVIHVPLTG